MLNCSINASLIVTKITPSFKQNFSKKADYTDENNLLISFYLGRSQSLQVRIRVCLTSIIFGYQRLPYFFSVSFSFFLSFFLSFFFLFFFSRFMKKTREYEWVCQMKEALTVFFSFFSKCWIRRRFFRWIVLFFLWRCFFFFIIIIIFGS